MRGLRNAPVSLLIVLAVAVVPATVAAQAPDGPLCRLADDRIDEASGLARSGDDGVVWLHNDSGDRPRFFGVDVATCATTATYLVTDADAVDWEDATAGTAPDGAAVLWFGDIGDNAAQRPGVTVYEVPEPASRPADPTAETPVAVRARYDITYQDGPHDAETLVWDPRSARLAIVTKAIDGPSGIYPFPLTGGGPVVAARSADLDVGALGGLVGAFDGQLTGGDISPDGSRLVLRTYLSVYEWAEDDPARSVLDAPGQGPAMPVAAPATGQGEAIGYAGDGAAVYITSEGAGAPLYRVAVGGEAPAPAPPPVPPTGGDEAGADNGVAPWVWVALSAGAGTFAAASIAARRRRRR
ncbi:MAG: hypothetical protein ACT4PW_04770 [Acidimicrobiia bacterium]